MSQYNEKENETFCNKLWEELKIHDTKYDSDATKNFVIDTPPPTVSGSLHMGHVFSYTHQDLIARFQRMRGKNIVYPVGWDDNGLATERRVQNYLGIRCNPKLEYNSSWKPLHRQLEAKDFEEVSRQNFIEACSIVTAEDEKAFERLWRRLGLSLDWSTQYATIDKHCIRISQFSFLDLIKKGYAYNHEGPTMWDTDFQSAIAQAEIEDREIEGAFHDIKFGIEGGGEFTIATTRPELLPACIAVAAHPDDDRYKHLFGKFAITPLFFARVPIVAAEHVLPDKGTGIIMISTFGDLEDVKWWKTNKVPARQIIGIDGRLRKLSFTESPFSSTKADIANTNYAQLGGLYVKPARRKIVELLSMPNSSVTGNSAALVGDPKIVKHAVKFYEKGEKPLEIITTRQWFIKILDYKQELLAQGRKIRWYPEHMRSRYENWVEGLNQDWCISRQRFFGVPFPTWYPLDGDGNPNYLKPIFADTTKLPVDPMSAVPTGYTESQRGKPLGFIGESDVMDTWATSGLTPQIVSHWGTDNSRHQSIFPMDIRPQSHEIIRTWAFYTIVKAWMHEGKIPWKSVIISGWILDPDRKKMSKSKGNVVTPEPLLDTYSSDAVRYWAARARLGVDTAFDESVIAVGRRLGTKIFNACKFVDQQLGQNRYSTSDITTPLDKSFVKQLATVIDNCTKAFSEFEYAESLRIAEQEFWNFCDNYLELIKVRSYTNTEEASAGKISALATLDWATSVFLRLFAPIMPYITEMAWQNRYTHTAKSVHIATWPASNEVSSLLGNGETATEPDLCFSATAQVIADIRAKKSQERKSLKWCVEKLIVRGNDKQLAAIRLAESDLAAAGSVRAIRFEKNTLGDADNKLESDITLAANES